MRQRTPLQRKTPMPRGSKPLRRTPIKSTGSTLPCRTSGKQRATAAAKTTARGNEPTRKVKEAVLDRDDRTCQRCRKDLVATRAPYSRQHLLPRGRGGGNGMGNLALVCGSATTPGMCHDEIEHQARGRCTMEGWLVPNGVDPEKWAVLRFGEHWARPTETGWVECEPHPLQLEWRLKQSQGAAA